MGLQELTSNAPKLATGPAGSRALTADASQLGTSVGTARGLWRTVLGRSESHAAARHATVTHPWFYLAFHLPRHRETATYQTTSSARRREVGRNPMEISGLPDPEQVNERVRVIFDGNHDVVRPGLPASGPNQRMESSPTRRCQSVSHEADPTRNGSRKLQYNIMWLMPWLQLLCAAQWVSKN